MYVYIESKPNVFTIGFYDPDGVWQVAGESSSRDVAEEKVHYLNSNAPELERLRSENSRLAMSNICLRSLIEATKAERLR